MGKIKDYFKNYKTKRELEKEVAYLRGMLNTHTPILKVERNVHVLQSTAVLERGMPAEYAKKECLHRLANELKPVVEWDVVEGREYGSNVLKCKLYVMLPAWAK